jgi:hypothetical protein
VLGLDGERVKRVVLPRMSRQDLRLHVGMILALKNGPMMRKALFLVVLLTVVATAALKLGRPRPGPMISAATPAAELVAGRPTMSHVKVRHELITVAAAPVPSPRRARMAAAGPPKLAAPRQTSPPLPEQQASSEATLLGKARRAIVGDGRHRPEPFPRVRDH